MATSNYTVGQTWGAIRKAWKAYRISKVQNNRTDMLLYAKRIRSLQVQLGVTVAQFPNLDLGPDVMNDPAVK
jgi:hypothetical protein